MQGRSLFFGLSLVLAGVGPAAAGFNDLLQVICDVDNIIVTGCDVTHDGLRYVHTVAVSPDDKHVYFCSSQGDTGGQKESLSAYARAVDGTLTLIDQEIEDSGGVSTLRSCRGVAVSPDGKHVYTAALTDSAVTWFQRETGMASPDFGKLSFTAGDAIVSGGPGGHLAGANAVVVSPDGKHVYVAGRSGDSVAVYSRDATTGDLTHLETEFDGIAGVDGLDAPEDLAVSPDGRHLYVASENDNAVAVFARDASAASATFGRLTFVEARFDGVAGADGLADASRLALDPAGANVYVGGERGSAAGDWFAVFSRNTNAASPDFGKLTMLQSFQSTALSVSIDCSGVGPSDSAVAVSPNGLFVAVAQPFFGALATFSRAADGRLTLVEAICDELLLDSDDIGAISDLAPSADGKHVYSAGGAFSLLSVIDYECDSPNVDLTLASQSLSIVKSETACRSITMGPDYDVLSAGTLTATAPVISLGEDVSFEGAVSLVNAVP